MKTSHHRELKDECIDIAIPDGIVVAAATAVAVAVDWQPEKNLDVVAVVAFGRLVVVVDCEVGCWLVVVETAKVILVQQHY